MKLKKERKVVVFFWGGVENILLRLCKNGERNKRNSKKQKERNNFDFFSLVLFDFLNFVLIFFPLLFFKCIRMHSVTVGNLNKYIRTTMLFLRTFFFK